MVSEIGVYNLKLRH